MTPTKQAMREPYPTELNGWTLEAADPDRVLYEGPDGEVAEAYQSEQTGRDIQVTITTSPGGHRNRSARDGEHAHEVLVDALRRTDPTDDAPTMMNPLEHDGYLGVPERPYSGSGGAE